MRFLALSILLVAACGKDEPKHVDASVTIGDAKPIDAAVDAPPDAPPDASNMSVVAACMHVCDALGVCFMEPTDPECYSDCQTDLADCTAQQVATIDACSTEMCGDIEDESSPIITCITNVACVEMAVALRRR